MPFDRSVFLASVFRFVTTTRASVTSWCRTPEHNTKVGGVPDSPHLEGFGVDVVYDHPGVGGGARDALAAELGLELVHEGDHDHIQPRGWGAGER